MSTEETSGSTARQASPDNEAQGGTASRPAGGTRRAVTLSAMSGDPGAAWTNLRPAPPGQTGTVAASQPSATAAHASPATVGQFEGAVRASTPGAGTGRTASEEEQQSAAGQAAAAPDAELAAAEEGRGESALGTPEAAAAAQPDPAQPGTDGDTPPGRPNKPMLAAAALAGVVLLGVPILMIGGDEDDEKKRENISNAAQDTLLGETGEEQAPSGKYAPSVPKQDSSKKPSADPSGGRGNKGGNGTQEDGKLAFDKAAEPVAAGQRPASRTHVEKQLKPSAPPSPKAAASGYWETKERKVSNANSGLCLTTVNGRVVGQKTCGTSVWTRYVMPGGQMLLKLKSANQCLDTNGGALYVSPCTPKDPGQVWRAFSAGDCKVALQASGGAYATGWNNGTVSMRARGDVDVAAKQKWGFSLC